MNFLAYILSLINVPVNAAFALLLAPVGLMPGWLSNTIIAAITGLILLTIFKYTSNQKAIGKIRDNIKANTLALKLFKDSLSITFLSQARLFKAALLLLVYSIVPMMVMIIPVSLLLAQMGLWYQARPLLPGEKTTVSMVLNDNHSSSISTVNIESIPGAEVLIGPVRILSKNEINWQIQAVEPGRYDIVFKVDEQQVEKQLLVGEGFMRISPKRPSWRWTQILQHPLEKPFTADSVVQSINIDYPKRSSKVSGTNYWLIYFFLASLGFSLLFKGFLKVRI